MKEEDSIDPRIDHVKLIEELMLVLLTDGDRGVGQLHEGENTISATVLCVALKCLGTAFASACSISLLCCSNRTLCSPPIDPMYCMVGALDDQIMNRQPTQPALTSPLLHRLTPFLFSASAALVLWSSLKGASQPTHLLCS